MKAKNMVDVPSVTEGGRKLYSARAVKQVLGLQGNIRRILQQRGLAYKRADLELEKGVSRLTVLDSTAIAALAEKYCDKRRADAIKRQLDCLEGRVV